MTPGASPSIDSLVSTALEGADVKYGSAFSPGSFTEADLGSDDWRDGLERLLTALADEARLNELGHDIAVGEIVTLLSTRLTVNRWRREHRELAGRPIAAPIVIVGQARTGTTILVDLLAQDPQMRVPLTWEVDEPVPPPTTATYDTDPRIDEVDARLAGTDLLIPGFRAMHPMGARLSQECVRMTASAFRSVIFPTVYRVPSYGQWVLYEADMAPAYRWHRRFLEHLQSQHPGPDAVPTRWLLKSPAHIWCLDALVAEYPDALLVQTHRDPLRIISSISSLQATLRSIASDDPTIPEIADEWAGYIIDGLDRSVDAREQGVVSSDRVVDVQFAAFMDDPFTTIHNIYDALGLELTEATESAMRAFLATHGQDHHGTHAYSFAETELDPAEWRERSHRYQEYFDVTSEPIR